MTTMNEIVFASICQVPKSHRCWRFLDAQSTVYVIMMIMFMIQVMRMDFFIALWQMVMIVIVFVIMVLIVYIVSGDEIMISGA